MGGGGGGGAGHIQMYNEWVVFKLKVTVIVHGLLSYAC